jgi:hypothetical protein
MVTSSHEALHRLFQEDPGVFARAFDRLGVPFPHPVRTSLLSPDLTEMRPLERRLDTLLQIESADGGSYLLAVESQGKKDPRKHGSWAYYASYLYSKYGMPPVLLVVCQDESTAQWAEKPFHIGLPHWRTMTVRPIALGPHNVPVVTDPADAAADIPLAVFAAIAHGKSPRADIMLKALGSAFKTVDETTASIFIEMTEVGLGTSPAAQIWKDIMAVDLSFFRSETSQKLRAEGRAEGRAEDVLFVLRHRGLDVSEGVRERVAGCSDPDVLRGWLTRAVTVDRAEEIFGDA